jgi:3-dehydroquinate dehydratase II
MKKIVIINGPNLNMLGFREPEVYGTGTYQQLIEKIFEYAEQKGIAVNFFQSNSEGAIIDHIHSLHVEKPDGVILNPGALAHYSYALYDAIKCVDIPFIEVHLSNITKREEFRKKSVTAPACKKQICGKGVNGYFEAIDFLME